MEVIKLVKDDALAKKRYFKAENININDLYGELIKPKRYVSYMFIKVEDEKAIVVDADVVEDYGG
jgi:hypothetical protein